MANEERILFAQLNSRGLIDYVDDENANTLTLPDYVIFRDELLDTVFQELNATLDTKADLSYVVDQAALKIDKTAFDTALTVYYNEDDITTALNNLADNNQALQDAIDAKATEAEANTALSSLLNSDVQRTALLRVHELEGLLAVGYENPRFVSSAQVGQDFTIPFGWLTAKGWEVTADSFAIPPVLAFTKGNALGWLSATTSEPKWLAIKYPVLTRVHRYRIKPFNNENMWYPTTWRLQGSKEDEGESWLNLENTRTLYNETGAWIGNGYWSRTQEREFTPDLPTALDVYRRFRLYITRTRARDANGASGVAGIGDWRLNPDPDIAYPYTIPPNSGAAGIQYGTITFAGDTGGGSGTVGAAGVITTPESITYYVQRVFRFDQGTVVVDETTDIYGNWDDTRLRPYSTYVADAASISFTFTHTTNVWLRIEGTATNDPQVNEGENDPSSPFLHSHLSEILLNDRTLTGILIPELSAAPLGTERSIDVSTSVLVFDQAPDNILSIVAQLVPGTTNGAIRIDRVTLGMQWTT